MMTEKARHTMWKLRSELETGKWSGSLAVRILRSIASDRLLLAFSFACQKGSFAPNADSLKMMSGGGK